MDLSQSILAHSIFLEPSFHFAVYGLGQLGRNDFVIFVLFCFTSDVAQ